MARGAKPARKSNDGKKSSVAVHMALASPWPLLGAIQPAGKNGFLFCRVLQQPP